MIPEVSHREYARLLGYPPTKSLGGDVRVRAEEAIEWYRRYGKPQVTTRRLEDAVVAGFTAGIEVEEEVTRLWDFGRVDEAYFLDRLAAAVVECLTRTLRDELGAGDPWSPGCGGFPLERQQDLFSLLAPLSPGIEILASGMLKPKCSMIAVYPLAGKRRRGSPCSRCGLVDCGFRGKVA